MTNPLKQIKNLTIPLIIFTLSACGGDSNKTATEIEAQVAVSQCVTADVSSQNDGCGTLLLGITDADGDFLNYTVDITALELIKMDGTLVSVMPSTQLVNFSDYVEVSELATAATIPAGIYAGRNITLDYANADIQVEKDGAAVSANMVDLAGEPLQTVSLQLQFDETNRLVISRRRPAILEIDFNLAASHDINLTAEPVTITTEPFILAEIDPILQKEFRVRGPLISVDEASSVFRISVRPFHRLIGRFGGLDVHSNEETLFEIDGESYLGSEGLTQMANLDPGVPTITLGRFNRLEDRFEAITVIAGSGIPGASKDGARGVIVARLGNLLTVHGASLIRRSGEVSFDDEITVIVGEETKVSKNRRFQEEVTIADLSIGQAITVLGDIDEVDGKNRIDATSGVVRMRITFTSGHVLASDISSMIINMQSLQGRRPEVYDFSGTGLDSGLDATPDNYEISKENIITANLEVNDPVRVSGFVNTFGSAPDDFNATTVINYAESRSQMLLDWPDGEDVTAFTQITDTGLTINTGNGDLEGLYKLIQGGIITQLNSLQGPVVVSPLGERGFYIIKTDDGISSYSNFAEFVAILQLKLDEGASVDKLHTIGGFSTDELTFSALKLAIKLNQ